jgi:hypothetical protein
MEDAVDRDGLWTSLLTGLSITEPPLLQAPHLRELLYRPAMLLSPL